MDYPLIRVASDLHLEGFAGRNAETLAIDFIPHDDRDVNSILVLGGDISSAPDQLVGFIRVLVPRFQKILYVPGNHEYYKHNYVAWNLEMADRFNEHLPTVAYAFGSVRALEVSGILFILATLWGDGGPTLADRGKVGFFLNDFRLISMPASDQGQLRRFTVDDMMRLSSEQKAGIRKSLEEAHDFDFQGPRVVVTHHLPSRRLVSARFLERDGSDGANGGFVTDCDNMICVLEPTLWIHGHTHDTIDTELWKTRVVCNPAGYRGEYATPYNTFMQPAFEPMQKTKPVVVPKFVELGNF